MMRKRTTFLSLLLAFVSVQGAYEDPVLSPETEVVVVECELQGKGAFDILVVPSWAPLGAERFLQLVDIGFFDGLGLFRAVENFLVQFGIPASQELNEEWRDKTMKDDPKIGTRLQRGSLAYAGSGVDSRSTQMFIALTSDHWPHLGKEPWETPFGFIPKSHMESVLIHLNTEYGDMPPWGKGPDQGKLQMYVSFIVAQCAYLAQLLYEYKSSREGYDYLRANFPRLDYLGYCKRRVEASDLPKDVESLPGLYDWSYSTFAFGVVALVAAVSFMRLLKLASKKSN